MIQETSSLRRKLLFAVLYFSEGAPIGFLWWALPTRLKSTGVSLADVTGLTAILLLPWTFKFLWAPLVDALQSPRWTLRHWIVLSQVLMGLTLLPLFWIDLRADFDILKWLLLAHAICAATQDVAIDALCISLTHPEERGSYNGWMQAGMLAGRSLLGGGALVLFANFGWEFVIGALLTATLSSMVLLFVVPEARVIPEVSKNESLRASFRMMWESLRTAFSQRTMWLGVLFALTGGAAFEALGAIAGPTLRSLNMSEETIGWIFAVPYVLAMVAGSIVGGSLADKFGHRKFVATSLLAFVVIVAAAGVQLAQKSPDPNTLAVLVCLAGFAIGQFTAASYAMFMDLTLPHVAGTQFSTFMGAANGCEAWAAKSIGVLALSRGIGPGLWILCGVSVLSLPLLLWLKKPATSSPEGATGSASAVGPV